MVRIDNFQQHSFVQTRNENEVDVGRTYSNRSSSSNFPPAVNADVTLKNSEKANTPFPPPPPDEDIVPPSDCDGNAGKNARTPAESKLKPQEMAAALA